MTPFVRTKATPNHSLPMHRRWVASRRVMLFTLSLVAVFSFGCSDGNAAKGGGDPASASPLPPVRLRVRVDPVRLEPFAADQAVTGTVRAFHKATITAETQGRILERKLEPGAAAKAGGVIIALESSRFELAVRRTTASLGAARTVFRHAERELARGDQLMVQKAISSQQHDDLTLAVDRARDEILLAEVARDTAIDDLQEMIDEKNIEDEALRAKVAAAAATLSKSIKTYTFLLTKTRKPHHDPDNDEPEPKKARNVSKKVQTKSADQVNDSDSAGSSDSD